MIPEIYCSGILELVLMSNYKEFATMAYNEPCKKIYPASIHIHVYP